MFTFTYACTSSEAITQSGGASFQSKVKELNPNFLVYHHKQDSSQLYFELNARELLYVRENVSQPFTANITLNYQLFGGKNNKELIDSATNSLIDKKTSSANKRIIGKIPLAISSNTNYKLKVTAVDLNKKIKYEEIILVDKTNKSNQQYFLIYNQEGEVFFDLNFTANESIIVESNLNNSSANYIGYYTSDASIAKPPFADQQGTYNFAITPDSIIPLAFVGNKASFTINKPGNYILKSANNNSFSIKYFDSDYPTIKNHEAMIWPIRYICTNSEFAALKEAKDKQAAVEAFWLKIGKTKERARYLIKEYYKRIEFANTYFTSYKEGWKTDRGMLSIVMGLPNNISTSGKGESWTYGTANNMMMSLSYTFDKRNEQYIDNDYQLDRYRSYKDYWYRAVETWRNGRAYSFN